MCKSCHVVLVQANIKSLDALNEACKRLGGQLHRNQKTFKWYGRSVGDYNEADAADKHGIAVSDFGKCEHAIHFATADYEIGLVSLPTGSYGFVWDFYDHRLKEIVGGTSCPRLMQAYAVEAAIEQARKQCSTFTETQLQDGSIQLKVSVNE